MLVLQRFDSAKFRWQFNYFGCLYSKETRLQKIYTCLIIANLCKKCNYNPVFCNIYINYM